MHDSARQAFECAVEIIETMENGTDRSRLRQIVLANLATSHIGRSNFTRGINVLETLIQPSLIDKVAIVQVRGFIYCLSIGLNLSGRA